MKVLEVMTVNVAAVGPDATLKQVARVLADRGVSGLPVVDEGHRVLGVVSEEDIVVKSASRPAAGILTRLFLPGTLEDRRLEATTAGEAMTQPAVTIGAAKPVAEAARVMVERDVSRLPVVDDGRLVGIVTRADIVRAFTRTDDEIWEELRNDVVLRELWIPPEDLEISVQDGRVRLAGEVDNRSVARMLEAAARRIPGVVTVDCSEVTWRSDDRPGRLAH